MEQRGADGLWLPRLFVPSPGHLVHCRCVGGPFIFQNVQGAHLRALMVPLLVAMVPALNPLFRQRSSCEAHIIAKCTSPPAVGTGSVKLETGQKQPYTGFTMQHVDPKYPHALCTTFYLYGLVLGAPGGGGIRRPPREPQAASTFCSRDASTRQPRTPDLSGAWQPNHWLRHNFDTRNVESAPCYSIRPVGASAIPWTIHGRSGKTLTTPRRVWLRARRPTSCLTSMTKHCRYFQGIGVEECALGKWLHAE